MLGPFELCACDRWNGVNVGLDNENLKEDREERSKARRRTPIVQTLRMRLAASAHLPVILSAYSVSQ
jgi:hypothetical protein